MIGYLCGGMISVKKKSRELMNSIMTSDEASEESEFLSALNASLPSFVHKTLKDEQIECIHRIACHERDVLAVLPTGLGKSALYVLSPFSLIRDFRKHPRKHFQHFRQSYMLSTDRIEIHQSQPASMRRECLKVTLTAVIGGFRSDLSITRKTSGNSA